jgi:hypothetical protein
MENIAINDKQALGKKSAIGEFIMNDVSLLLTSLPRE